MSAPANTKDCFRACVGKSIHGVMFDAMPVNRRDINAGTKTLIFSDGTGLTISWHGTFWLESAKDVKRAMDSAKKRIKDMQAEISSVEDV